MGKSYPIGNPGEIRKLCGLHSGKSKIELIREIKENWPRVQLRAMASGFKIWIPVLPNRLEILGTSTKVEKSRKLKTKTKIQYLNPGRQSGIELCGFRCSGCTGGCLGNTASRLRMFSGKNSKTWKTMLMIGDTVRYFSLLQIEIESHIRSCQRDGIVPSLRLDGSSDTGMADALSEIFPDCIFYDYTKSKFRMNRFLSGSFSDNRHLTFSRSSKNHDASLDILNRGGSVAVPVLQDKSDWPSEWQGFPVFDATETDARFWDEPGWQFLTWIGPKSDHAEKSGFLVDLETTR